MAKIHNPKSIAPPLAKYSHGIEVGRNARWLHMSGQVGTLPDGKIAQGFEAQCKAAFDNLLAILADADMGPEDVVKMTVFIIDRANLPVYRKLRDAALGEHLPASTLLVVAGLASPELQVEIEMIAAKG